MRYSALADSKCIRAGLVFASGNLNKEISNSALIDMATSIELMHTYSLIHDDLPSMDNDEMRRGQASNHIKFNEATAILTGDALQALAYENIVSSPEITQSQKIASIKALSNACGHEGMILGQQYDLDAETTLNAGIRWENQDRDYQATGPLDPDRDDSTFSATGGISRDINEMWNSTTANINTWYHFLCADLSL